MGRFSKIKFQPQKGDLFILQTTNSRYFVVGGLFYPINGSQQKHEDVSSNLFNSSNKKNLRKTSDLDCLTYLDRGLDPDYLDQGLDPDHLD